MLTWAHTMLRTVNFSNFVVVTETEVSAVPVDLHQLPKPPKPCSGLEALR